MTRATAKPCTGFNDKSRVDVRPVDRGHEGDTMLTIDPVERDDGGPRVPEYPR